MLKLQISYRKAAPIVILVMEKILESGPGSPDFTIRFPILDKRNTESYASHI